MNKDSRGNNCRVLGTDASAADYISTSTPMQLKKREFMNSPEYKTLAESDLNRSREKAVTAARQKGNVRPTGGHGA